MATDEWERFNSIVQNDIPKLSEESKIILCLCLIERAIPNYNAFCNNGGTGNCVLLNKLVTTIWNERNNLNNIFIKYPKFRQELDSCYPPEETESNMILPPAGTATELCGMIDNLLTYIQTHDISYLKNNVLTSAEQVRAYVHMEQKIDHVKKAHKDNPDFDFLSLDNVLKMNELSRKAFVDKRCLNEIEMIIDLIEIFRSKSLSVEDLSDLDFLKNRNSLGFRIKFSR